MIISKYTRKPNHLISTILSFLLVLALSINSVNAIAAETPEGFYLNPHIGTAAPGDTYDFDSDLVYGIGAGYRFNKDWSIEFVADRMESQVPDDGYDITVSNYRVDALYHLTKQKSFQPHLSAGLGAVEYDISSGERNTEAVFNVGAGFIYPVSDRTNLRGDIKIFHSHETLFAGPMATFGVHHYLGAKNKPTRSTAKMPKTSPDNDRDGVIDAMDKCPATNAGEQVDNNGCSIDRDADGVPDSRDKCPNTTNQNAKIDASGCYVMGSEAVTIHETFYFDNNSSVVKTEHAKGLRNLSDFIEKHPNTLITVTGHADAKGDPKYNEWISFRRATNITNALIQQANIDASRIEMSNRGETELVMDEWTSKAHASNRRVVVSAKTNVEKMTMKK